MKDQLILYSPLWQQKTEHLWMDRSLTACWVCLEYQKLSTKIKTVMLYCSVSWGSWGIWSLPVCAFCSLFFVCLNFIIFQVGSLSVAIMSSPVAFQCSFNENESYSQICLWLPVTARFYLCHVAQSLCAGQKKKTEGSPWFMICMCCRHKSCNDHWCKSEMWQINIWI